MEINKGDEICYWLSYNYNNSVWSRAYKLKDAQNIVDHPNTEMIEIYKITTNKTGKVSFQPLKTLDDLNS